MLNQPDLVDKVYLTLGAVYEEIVDTPGMEDLTRRVRETIRDMAEATDIGVLEVDPCGDPECDLGPYCCSGEVSV